MGFALKLILSNYLNRIVVNSHAARNGVTPRQINIINLLIIGFSYSTQTDVY
jgi:hypothetical protein